MNHKSNHFKIIFWKFLIIGILITSLIPTNVSAQSKTEKFPITIPDIKSNAGVRAPLNAPIGISPNGTTESNPVTLTWQAEPNVNQYWLWIDDNLNGKEWDDNAISPTEAGCAGGSGNCSYTLPVNLVDGNKSWWILAFYADGSNSGWTTPLDFIVNKGGS